MNLTALATAFAVGATLQLTASEASGFTTSNPAIATVDSNGLVTGLTAGPVTITAISLSDATQTASLDLAVTAAVAPASIALAEPAADAAKAAAPGTVIPAVSTDTLKMILSALGHDLEAVWDDAVALAKKAL